MDKVEKIATAVLYEGYVLWPYRRSTIKNQQRWTLGGVYPRAHSEIHGDSDPWLMQTQCLVKGDAPIVRVAVRFLHVVKRQVTRQNPDGNFTNVDELQVDDEHYLTWDEAAERDVVLENLELAQMKLPRQMAIDIPAGDDEELLRDADGNIVGKLVRSWESLQGEVEVEAKKLEDDLFRLTARITNTTLWNGEDRPSTMRRTFVSAHTILTVQEGEFISLMDPPEELKDAAEACENIKTWPVLAGEEGDKSTFLSSPIILYDYPQVAPESGGDFYDGAEIDQLLVLNMLSLTDEEKAEIRATDPRARAILERSEAYGAEEFMGLHGAMRDFQVLRKAPEEEMFPVWSELERPAPTSVMVGGVELSKGSRVTLRPRRGADIMDIALDGKTAIIEAIDQDDEDAIHFSVTVEDDPGRDLGEARVLGHRFFFKLEEVEPLEQAS